MLGLLTGSPNNWLDQKKLNFIKAIRSCAPF